MIADFLGFTRRLLLIASEPSGAERDRGRPYVSSFWQRVESAVTRWWSRTGSDTMAGDVTVSLLAPAVVRRVDPRADPAQARSA